MAETIETPRAALTGRIRKVCMACGDTYGYAPTVPADDGKVTSGYCPACFPAVEARTRRALDNLYPRKGAPCRS